MVRNKPTLKIFWKILQYLYVVPDVMAMNWLALPLYKYSLHEDYSQL